MDSFNKIGIIGAMEVEIEVLLKNIEYLKSVKYGMFEFFQGLFAGKELVIVKSGAGKVNSSSCAQMLIDKYDIDCIINTGIAGGISENLNVCDLVISKEVTYHDVNPIFMKDFFPFKESFEADLKLVYLAIKAVEGIDDRTYKYFSGRIVSGDKFVSAMNDKLKIVERYDPLCVEMEGASIGHVCYLNRVPFVVIRSISDGADDQAEETYKKFERRAAEQSSNIILEMIKLI